MLEIRDLDVHFRTYQGVSRVLDRVSLSVSRGERVGLAGETGCGKTVTMKAVMGMLKTPPAIIPSGEIFLDGHDILNSSSEERLRMKGAEISMIFQDPMSALNPVFTIKEQLRDTIRFGSRYSETPKLSRDGIHARAVAALREVGLPDPERIMQNYPFQLSGGMRQRVLIAMALVNEPSFLVADEPGTALDVTIQAQILDLLNELVGTKKISILIITHNLGVMQEIAERVYVMYDGQIVETAPTAVLFENPKHPYSQGLIASVPRLTGGEMAKGVPGTVPDFFAIQSGCRFKTRCEHAMPVCSQKKPPLQVFEPSHHVACYLYGGKTDRHE
jgi:peptide/nickel transport system ATP-binding protein